MKKFVKNEVDPKSNRIHKILYHDKEKLMNCRFCTHNPTSSQISDSQSYLLMLNVVLH